MIADSVSFLARLYYLQLVPFTFFPRLSSAHSIYASMGSKGKEAITAPAASKKDVKLKDKKEKAKKVVQDAVKAKNVESPAKKKELVAAKSKPVCFIFEV